MDWMKALFKTNRPIIGLLHLQALPGDPFYNYTTGLQGVIERAKADLEALQQGGVDAILITNEFSLPYEKKVSGVTLAAMGTVIGSLLPHIGLPFGAEAIYDGDASIELCAGCGAAFTRCMFTGAWAGDLGLIDRDISRTLRLKAALRLDNLRMFYFVTSEGEVYLNDRSTTEITQSMLFNCHPDALVVGGDAPGQSPGPARIAEVQKVANGTPVVCGTGCKLNNVADILQVANGAYVGTTFKKDGLFENPVDVTRVKEFMQRVNAVREG